MYPRIRIISLFALSIIFSQYSFAGESSARPIKSFFRNFLATIKKADKDLNHNAEAKSAVKICSCQILHLSSTNYQHENIAVFAEATNHGNATATLKNTKWVIEKEKKHLKQMFYDQLQVLAHAEDASDCKSLYAKLKASYTSLVMYDVLDADIR